MMSTTYSKDDLQSQTADSIQTFSDTSEEDLLSKYDLEKCCDWIMKSNYQTTCLQFPERLLNDGTSIALYLQKKLKRPVYIIAGTSYGSCCVDEVAAEHVDADSIIHFGHACLSCTTKLPVLYIFEKENLDINNFYNSCQIFENNMIIFYDDIYHHLYLKLCSKFKNMNNVKVSQLLINNEKNDASEIICGRAYIKNPRAKASAVYIGDDSITLQNLVLGLPDFKWYRYSKEEKLQEYNFSRNKFLMQRNHLVEKIQKANVIGILIGTLVINKYLDAVDRIKLLVKRRGKKYYMLVVGKPNAAKLANFPEIDVFVYIACQENSLLKDFKDYYKPVVSLFEIELALGNRPFSMEYTSDFKELLPGGLFYKQTKLDCEISSDLSVTSQELIEKDSGIIAEYSGSQFLTNRTWRGLELNKNEIEVCKATKGRSGIPGAYENELKTLSEENEL